MALSLKWKRPETLEYPKIWHTFKARDLDSDKLVEYRIQDLPLDRIDDAFEHMFAYYVREEPIGQVLGKSTAIIIQIKRFYSKYLFGDGVKDPKHLEDYKSSWQPMIEQKLPLVCFKAGSDEIVGMNMLFVITKEDTYLENLYKSVGLYLF